MDVFMEAKLKSHDLKWVLAEDESRTFEKVKAKR